MGGLARKMPLTAVTWIVGAAALAGIPPLAGFFSKDAVVSAVYLDSPFAGVTLSAASLLTAFYVARATRLAFFGDYRGNAHPHEGPWTMKLPLVALAVPAVVLGLATTPFAELLGHEAEEFSLPLLAASVAIAIVGLVVGWFALRFGAASVERLESRLGSVWRGAAVGWGVDGLVMRFVVAPAVTLSRIVYAFIDRLFIDWVVEGVAVLSAWIGRAFARLQNGDAQWYATLIAVGMLIVLVMTIWAGRLGL
jgi:NADH-quinone oxidoreductase subunit L